MEVMNSDEETSLDIDGNSDENRFSQIFIYFGLILLLIIAIGYIYTCYWRSRYDSTADFKTVELTYEGVKLSFTSCALMISLMTMCDVGRFKSSYRQYSEHTYETLEFIFLASSAAPICKIVIGVTSTASGFIPIPMDDVLNASIVTTTKTPDIVVQPDLDLCIITELDKIVSLLHILILTILVLQGGRILVPTNNSCHYRQFL